MELLILHVEALPAAPPPRPSSHSPPLHSPSLPAWHALASVILFFWEHAFGTSRGAPADKGAADKGAADACGVPADEAAAVRGADASGAPAGVVMTTAVASATAIATATAAGNATSCRHPALTDARDADLGSARNLRRRERGEPSKRFGRGRRRAISPEEARKGILRLWWGRQQLWEARFFSESQLAGETG